MRAEQKIKGKIIKYMCECGGEYVLSIEDMRRTGTSSTTGKTHIQIQYINQHPSFNFYIHNCSNCEKSILLDEIYPRLDIDIEVLKKANYLVELAFNAKYQEQGLKKYGKLKSDTAKYLESEYRRIETPPGYIGKEFEAPTYNVNYTQLLKEITEDVESK